MYLPALASHPAGRVVAVCGRRSHPAAELAQRWGVPSWCTDPYELMDSGVDAVIVATSNDSHFPLSMAALERGLHVLCEKPLALNGDQAAVMAEAASRTGRITMVPFTYHYMPVNRWVHRLIRQGYVGRVRHVDVRYYTGFAHDPGYSWRFDADVAGAGIIGDLGSHWIHLAGWLMGEPEVHVSATSTSFVTRQPRPDGSQYDQLEDSAVMTVRYDSGAYAVLHTSAVCAEETPFGQSHHLEVHGDEGTLYATCDWDTVQEVRGMRRGEGRGLQQLPIPLDLVAGLRTDSVHNTYRDVFRTTEAMTRAWATAIAAGQPVTPDFDTGLAVQRVVDAALRSTQLHGAAVAVPASGHHWSRRTGTAGTLAGGGHADVHVLAIDHRWQLEEMFDAAAVPRSRIAELKGLLSDAYARVAAERSDTGLLVDDEYGAEVLQRWTGRAGWLARALDVPRSRPVEFAGGHTVTATLAAWPADQIAKLMVYAHPDDTTDVADAQWRRLVQYTAAAMLTGRRILVEFQSPAGVDAGDDYLPHMLASAYQRGVRPHWWKLPPIADEGQWHRAAAVIDEFDPSCEGMLVLGQTAGHHQVQSALAAAASEPRVRGFAIGRAIFGEAVQAWLTGSAGDAQLVDDIAARYSSTIASWAAVRQVMVTR
jgi:myo-inositol catabolism protein IolC/predicted dehydrogenase